MSSLRILVLDFTADTTLALTHRGALLCLMESSNSNRVASTGSVGVSEYNLSRIVRCQVAKLSSSFRVLGPLGELMPLARPFLRVCIGRCTDHYALS